MFLAKEPSRYPFLSEELIHPLVLDTDDPHTVLAALKIEKNLAGVFSSSEYFLETVAFCARELGLPGACPTAINLCRDKALLAASLQKAGVPVPETLTIRSEKEAITALETMAFPLVIKPSKGSGSIDVALHKQRDTYLKHIKQLLAKNTNERGQRIDSCALAQSFADGTEYSVEVISDQGEHRILGITRKHLGCPPHFLEMGHDFPAPLALRDREILERVVVKALDAVGLSFGPSHTEVRYKDGKATIIEINPRLAGGMIPILLDTVLGVDLLGRILDLFSNKATDFPVQRRGGASIRFVVPKTEGVIKKISWNAETCNTPQLVSFQIQSKPGGAIRLRGDFRDRIGYIIAKGETPEESRANADRILNGINLVMESEEARAEFSPSQDTGRLKKTLHPEALAIVRVPPSASDTKRELGFYTAIDEAHLLMCGEAGILSRDKTRPILREIQRLKSGDFDIFQGVVAPRGSYFLYEDALVKTLGPEVGGITHIARSRNDINATVFRLRFRAVFGSTYRSLWKLRSELLTRAARTRRLAMPIYSQFQPGMPGTLAHYLLGVQEALARDQSSFQSLKEDLNRSPLGAGAGCGASFPIDTAMTARLLGFGDVCNNALDAVASRDLALRFLSAAAITGMTLSRLAQDLQLWTTREFGFFELPDELSGGSSMLPQKKNPYLLEMIKGKAIAASGQLATALATMQKVPFCNSVEVGTESLIGLDKSAASLSDAANLLRLIVSGMKPVPPRMHNAAERGVVIASCISDELVRKRGMPFRDAHHQVGEAIRIALEKDQDPLDALSTSFPDANLETKSLLDWADSFQFGGGPGASSTDRTMERAVHDLNRDAAWIHRLEESWLEGEALRARLVQATLNSDLDRQA